MKRSAPAVACSVVLALGALAPAAVFSQPASATLPTLAPMIKKVSPTVVGIATTARVQQRNPLYDDPFFRRFFNLPPPQSTPREAPLASGSGVVIDAKKGYIVTNAHVVANASSIKVTLDDGREIAAKIVGSDPASDIALLQVESTSLSEITLGDSDEVQVGDFVVAIGNPFGLSHTVTSGIVSGLGRWIGGDDIYQDYIQTDASINPGNSGGALVNLRGELIGINAAILSGSGGNIGIGFAIPVNMVKAIVAQLIEYGEVKRGVLGVVIMSLTPDVSERIGAPQDLQGALVSEVQPGSAAEEAGIKIYDVITSINGKRVRSNSELRNAIGLLRVGEKVKVGLWRGGKNLTVTATIRESTAGALASAGQLHPGLEGAELADAENGQGVLVRSVTPGSPAAQFGLRPDDIIYAANQTRVRNLQELREAIGNDGIAVLRLRRGNRDFLIQIR